MADPHIGADGLEYLHPSQFKDIQVHPIAVAHAIASIWAGLSDNHTPLDWSKVSGQPMTVQDPVVSTDG